MRQQSEDVYAVGFDALVERWCIDVGGGHVEKYIVFSLGSNIKYFAFYTHLWPIYLLSLV
jgi:hypothetical protein